MLVSNSYNKEIRVTNSAIQIFRVIILLISQNVADQLK